MAEIIRFDDEKFLKLYSLPVKYLTKRTRAIMKAYEIYHRVKQKQEEQCKNEKLKR